MNEKEERRQEPEDRTMIRDLTRGHVGRQLITFAAPLFLSSLLQIVYSLVDMVVVGQFGGSVGVSAVHIGTEVAVLLAFVAMGMCSALQVIVAQYVGAGWQHKLNNLIGTAFTFLMLSALTLSALCLIFIKPIISAINTPAEAVEQATAYVATCAGGMIFVYGYHMVSAVLRGMGDSKRPLLFIGVASVLNVILDLLFVGVLKKGAFGAALATVIGQSLSFFLALIYLYKRKEQFGFDFRLKSFRIDREPLKPLIRLGIPMMLQSIAVNFARLFTGAWINTYGTVVIAVSGIGNKMQMVANQFAQSVITAGSSMIAQNVGAEKYKRVPKIFFLVGLITVCFCTVLSLITALFPDFVFGLFVNEKDVLLRAQSYVPVVVLLFAGSALRAPCFALINGSGNSKLNLAVALLDGVAGRIGVTLLMGLVFNLGINGFWYGEALAGFIPFFIGGIYFLTGRWKTRKYLIRTQ